MKILEIGPGPQNSKGGIAAVIKGLLEDSELNINFDIDLHESYCDGNLTKRLLYSICKYIKFKKIYKPYEIFHIHMASYGSTFRKGFYIRFLKKHKKKVVLHVHGGEYLVFYNKISEIKKKIVKKIWRDADTIIVLSENWKKEFGTLFECQNITVIHNGIDFERFEKAQCNIKTFRKNFLFLGRLGQLKGTYDIVEAVKQLKDDYIDIKVYMAGDGEIERVKAMVKERGLEKNIEVVGWLNFSGKINLMQKCSTILLPSYNEGLPMAILEGMAAGKVIISTCVGGIPEVVVNKENGITISPGDINALSCAMKKIIEDEQFDIDCSIRNIKKIHQSFSERSMHLKLENIFWELK